MWVRSVCFAGRVVLMPSPGEAWVVWRAIVSVWFG
jgi:hypothetical protein